MCHIPYNPQIEDITLMWYRDAKKLQDKEICIHIERLLHNTWTEKTML